MDVCSSNGSVMFAVTTSKEDDGGLSSEDSSCPDDAELDLALGLSVGLNSRRNHSKVRSSLSSSSSSLTRESGTKRSADSKGQVAVGWPPLRTYRINSLINQAKSLTTEKKKNDDEGFMKPFRTSKLVKVTMDGVIIGRKIDLTALDSYVSLAENLLLMFFKIPSSITSSELLDGSSEYIITYQDKDGDWMLVGDVPWQMFLGSAKKLRIMRTSSDTRFGK